MILQKLLGISINPRLLLLLISSVFSGKELSFLRIYQFESLLFRFCLVDVRSVLLAKMMIGIFGIISSTNLFSLIKFT